MVLQTKQIREEVREKRPDPLHTIMCNDNVVCAQPLSENTYVFNNNNSACGAIGLELNSRT